VMLGVGHEPDAREPLGTVRTSTRGVSTVT